MLLGKHNKSNQYQYSNSNNRAHNYERHYTSHIIPSPTHRPQSQNVILPNASLLFCETLGCFWFITHYTSIHYQSNTHHYRFIIHLPDFFLHIPEGIVHSLATMFPIHRHIPPVLRNVSVLPNKRLITLLPILSSGCCVPNLEPNGLTGPYTFKLLVRFNAIGENVTTTMISSPQSY